VVSKICVAHGGGFIPTYAGRMDHAHRERDDCREIMASPPSSYLRKFYFDTLVFEPDQLAFLIEKYGADHILLGTDYPYDMGEEDPLGLVRRVDKLNADARAAVCGLNAARLLKLDI
jgi:aminocarboxymuconate-semialdehyde decarboxylase